MQLQNETRKLMSKLGEGERAQFKAILGLLKDEKSGTLVHAHCGDGLLGAVIDSEFPARFAILGIEPGREQADASRRRVYSRIRREDYGQFWQKHRDYNVYVINFGLFPKRIGVAVVKYLARGNPLLIAVAGDGEAWTAEDFESIGLRKVVEGVHSNRL